tara:strand:+ start:760 stop:924 length:165 start_codon:yes stop_codon:yes gene_type:complete
MGDGIEIKTAILNHPNDATGYRIEHGDKSLYYETDTEHVPGRVGPQSSQAYRRR